LFKVSKTYHIKIILFFYLFSAYVSATHIHHDTFGSHDNCKVCVVSNNLQSGDIVSTTPILREVDFNYEEPYEVKTLLNLEVYKGFYSQAPPL